MPSYHYDHNHHGCPYRCLLLSILRIIATLHLRRLQDCGGMHYILWRISFVLVSRGKLHLKSLPNHHSQSYNHHNGYSYWSMLFA